MIVDAYTLVGGLTVRPELMGFPELSAQMAKAGIDRAAHNDAGDQQTGEGAESPEQASQSSPLAPPFSVIYDRYAL